MAQVIPALLVAGLLGAVGPGLVLGTEDRTTKRPIKDPFNDPSVGGVGVVCDFLIGQGYSAGYCWFLSIHARWAALRASPALVEATVSGTFSRSLKSMACMASLTQ